MDAHICNHPKVRHTVIYRLGKGEVAREFPDLEDANEFAQKILRQNSSRLNWLKIFRSDNELYCCFVWESPKQKESIAEEKVKLEIDMEPLASAFENVALGFKNQGSSIKKLWFSQAILASLLVIDISTRLF